MSTETGSRKQTWFRRPIIKILLAVVICAGVLLSLTDIRKILSVAQMVEPLFLALAFLATILSYTFIGLALRRILNLLGRHLSFREMFAISWVSTALNYLVSTGGVGGLAMRVFLLRKKNISFSETFLVSFVHTLLINGVLIGFVVFGFGYLLTKRGLHLYQYMIAGGVLAIALLLSFLAAGSVINQPFRERFIDFFYRLINSISRRLRGKSVFKRDSLDEFKEEFNEGISLMLVQKGRIVVPLFHVFLEWLFTLLTLYFSFITIGYRISPGVLIVGFAIGIFVSFISLIPGSIGIMEGSMAGIFYSLGIPLEVGIMAVLLYRLVYYIFPFVTSTVLYYPLFKEARAARVSETLL